MSEKWMTPALYEGTAACDETALCQALGTRKESVLRRHHEEFIADEDLGWIAARGLNAIRIPVGHWIFGDVAPYVGSIGRLDWAMQAAQRLGLQVVIDLHAAPGSQNGWDHSGMVGAIGWDKDPAHIERTVAVIGRLAQRYAGKQNLAAIELMNEPNWNIPRPVLEDYYSRARQAVRDAGCNCPVIISDAFRPYTWRKVMADKSTWLDIHLYQCFDEADKLLDMPGHIEKAEREWSRMISDIQRARPAVIGEWSLGLDPRALAGMSKDEAVRQTRAYGEAQISTFNKAAGWFFWSYKLQGGGGWNFRHCVETGLLPETFGILS